jgi:hypothetical protein
LANGGFPSPVCRAPPLHQLWLPIALGRCRIQIKVIVHTRPLNTRGMPAMGSRMCGELVPLPGTLPEPQKLCRREELNMRHIT